MSGWKATDAQANNKPSYIVHVGLDNQTTNTYIKNTILVDASRNSNANIAFGVSSKAVPHTGWVNMTHGTGPLATITVANVNPLLTYTNDYFTIVGANTGTIVPLVSANAQMVVTGGSNITVTINSTGSGYIINPVVTSATSGNANNATLLITAKTSGRSNRVQTEVLVALSSASSANAAGAQPWFAGV